MRESCEVPNVTNTTTGTQPEYPHQLLTVVRTLVKEVHPGSTAAHSANLDSALDRDLGLDSLSRVELFSRLEREFNVDLPESLVAEARTPGDFLNAILTRAGVARAKATSQTVLPAHQKAGGIPDTIPTLIDALAWQAAVHGERIHVHVHGEGGTIEQIPFQALYREARAIAVGLRRSGCRPGQTVALMLPTGRDFFSAFSGILLAGAIPVPIYPPTRLTQLEEHLMRQTSILNNADVTALITVPEGSRVARLLKGQVPTITHVTTAVEAAGDPEAFQTPYVTAQDTAFLQYTSGSTGSPKGVVLTHANLLSNIRAMRDVTHVTEEDVFVSWLPLYHDMGLIGAWLGALVCGYPLAIMSPLSFLTKPVRWLKAIHMHRGTISAAPNFAYELCASHIADQDLEGVDLSSWRLALNGAEPVNPDTLDRFATRFARHGFRREAMLPVYGLAESTVGVAFPPPARGPLIDRIRREPFVTTGAAIPAEAGETDVLRFVSCGGALPGHQIRIADEQGGVRPERVEGHLQFTGPSATSGYLRNPEETERMKLGAWLDSFDLAYMANGEVYVTGRTKDLIIRGGRNLHPYELELSIGQLPGMRKGCVAVFGSRDRATATEKLVVVAETKQRHPAQREDLRRQIMGLATDIVGSPPDDIVLAPPHAVLKTSSGKIRRTTMRERYEQGTIGTEHPQSWQSVAKLGLTGLAGQLGRRLRAVGERAYGFYCVTAGGFLLVIAWLLVAITPSKRAAYGIARLMARTLIRLCGLSPQVTGLSYLADETSRIIVSNHSSYLDGMILFAVLPGQPIFTVKGELERAWVMRVFLRKLGVQFVERFAVEKSVAAADHLAKRLEAHETLVFFPEGTFRRRPGLLPFRLGAFTAAVRSQTPIVPMALQGTRTVLPEGDWLPRPGRISIVICPPIAPVGNDFKAALSLRRDARAVILHHVSEPDIVDPTETALTKIPV
ncbi:acyl-CoA synthetase [Nitrospira sp.]|nr:acyl-CoA synthetase [Nitrospira sp.]